MTFVTHAPGGRERAVGAPGFGVACGNTERVRRVRKRVIAFAAVAVALLAAIATIAVPALRSAAAMAALKIALRERGFAVRSATLHVSGDLVDLSDVEIDDSSGKPVLKAAHAKAVLDPRVWVGRSDRRYGLISLDIYRPTLDVVRLVDGSYNIAGLFGNGSVTAQFGKAAMRADIALRDGTLNVDDPTAPAIPGRHFAVQTIQIGGRIDQSAVSALHLSGVYAAQGARTPLSVAFFENDGARFAQATLRCGPIDVAPVVDGLVPTKAFAIDTGIVRDVHLHAFSIDYDPESGPQWQLSGRAHLADAQVRVLPLTVPLHDVNGDVAFAGGELASTGLDGTLEGAPVHVVGGLRILGGVRLALAVRSRQSLGDLKRAFVFSTHLDVRGPVDVALRVDGAPATLDVATRYAGADQLSYAGLPLSYVEGTMFYTNGHVTLPSARGEYDHGAFSLQGDIDLTAPVVSGTFDLVAAMPASALPIAANMNPSGTARAIGEFDGPIAALQGMGYADIVGGNGTVMRTAAYAGPQRFAVGPAIVDDARGGEFIGSGAIDRTDPQRTISGEIVARSAWLHFSAGSYSLPGINDMAPVTLPAVDGILGGTVLVRGDERAPAVYVTAAADGLTVAGTRLGHVAVTAGGLGGRVRIARVSIAGADAVVDASGSAVVEPHLRTYAAELQGVGRADIGAFATGVSGTSHAGVHGTASGDFRAALAGGRWTVAVRASSPNARVGAVRMESIDASLGGGGGGTTDVYAGLLKTPGGDVSAMGVVPAPNNPQGDLHLWTDGMDLASLAPAGSHLRSGHAVAVAHVGGSLSSPVVSGAASVTDANVDGQPLAGDVDVQYGSNRLVARDGRIALGGGFALVDGSVTGIGGDAPSSDAALSLTASMREGDLGALASRYVPRSISLTGTVTATLRVTGTLGSPVANGFVDADSGTLQGVAFENLRGAVRASSTSVDVTNGAVGLGSSHFDFSGSVSPSVVHIRASSAKVDLADFNDFFAGYDTLDGKGSGEIAFESTRTGVQGSGAVDLAGAAVLGFPLGTVSANFSSRRDQVLANVSQHGDAGSSVLRGSVTFAPRRRALPDLRHATYDVSGSVRGADLGRIAPLVGREDLGVTGLVDADGALHGSLQSPTGHAVFTLRDGHVGKVAITSASGTVQTDGRTISIRNAALALPFAHVDGEGSIGPGKRVTASVGIDASDLGTIFALGGHPGVASGTALASVSVSGTLAAPHVETTIVSGRGTALGVGFDRLSGRVTYAPGEVDIADTQVDLAGNRGVIAIGGTLPLQLSPFGLGPKQKPINLTLSANAVDVSAFDPLTARRASLTGMLDANGNVSGTAGRPQLTGSARLRRGSVSSPYETVSAENIDAELTLARDMLTLGHLRADLGKGTVAGTGAIHIVPAVGLLNVASLQYWTRLDLRGAQIDVPGWTSGSVSGDLRLTKSGSVPYLSGNLTLDDGSVPFSAIYKLASGYGTGPAPETGPLPGVPELQPGHIVVYGGPVFGEGGPYVLSAAPGAVVASVGPERPSVDLAVDLRAGRNVRVHGGAIDLTATGSLLIGANLRSPTLAGSFSSTRGQIGYFDTNFRLVRGTVTFDPVEGLLPTLDVKAITNLGGSEITLTVTGRVDNLQTDLSSNPSMSRDEIIATLLHAPQVESVISATPGQAQTALYTEAQSYFNAQLARSLLFPVESLLAQTINVEQISLIYDQQGKVDVEVRKLVTPNVYAIYRSSLNIPVTQTAGVAYSLRDYADLEILQTQSTTGLQQTVLNLRLTFH